MLLTSFLFKCLGVMVITACCFLFLFALIAFIIVLCTMAADKEAKQQEKVRDEFAELIYKQNIGEI